MSRLGARVARLEQRSRQRLERRRCSLCRPWPKARVVEIGVEGAATWLTPDVPEQCPDCGWRPIVVQLIEVEDWERVGKYGLR
jgi:hypothetical protein